MNDKLSGWRLVLACMLLIVPSLIVGLLLIHLVEGVTGSTALGYVVGFLVAGAGPAVPLIISVHKSKRLKVAVKYIVIVVAVFLFMGGIFMMTRTPHTQYEEFKRRQQEWESMKSTETTGQGGR